MRKIYLLLIAMVAGSLPSLAQQEAVLHSMRSLPQAQTTNPAFIPQQQFYLGLPGISSTYLSIANSGFNYNSIVDLGPDGRPQALDLVRFQNGLAKKNYISMIGHTDLLSMGMKINARMYLTFNSTAKLYNRFMYPEGLTGLIISGNGAYLGQEVAFSPAIDHISYLENAIGGSYIINNKLTVGTRFKFLKGIGNIRTEASDFTIATDAETYALTLTGNMQVKAAGFYDYIKEDGEDFDSETFTYSDLRNNGFAMDLGATYKVNTRLEVGFSALNLGRINWKTGVGELFMNEVSAEFKGLDAQELANDGDGLGEFADELEEKFKFEDREAAPYRTGLPTQFYLSARYELLRNLHANGLFFSELYNGRFMPAFSAALNKDFGRRLSTTVSYTASNRSYNNLGAGFAFRLTPIQFYMVSDNLISTPLFYRSAKAFNFRLGFNMVFGYRKSETKLPSAN